MKKVWLLFWFSLPAQAGEISCYVNEFYSSMKVTWDEKNVTAEVKNPRGYSSMPQFEAPLAADAFALMKMQAEQLGGLGPEFAYQWERSQCDFAKEDSWLVSCHGASKSLRGDNGVKGALFTTARIEETSLSGSQHLLRLRFIFDKGSLFFAALPFPLQFCQVNK